MLNVTIDHIKVKLVQLFLRWGLISDDYRGTIEISIENGKIHNIRRSETLR